MLQKTPKATIKLPKPKVAKPKPFSLECDRDELVAALNLVGTAIDRQTTLPILGHVLFWLSDNTLELIGTDLDVRVKHTIKCKGYYRKGVFTLPWWGLAKAIMQLPRGVVNIYVDPVALKASVESGETQLTYNTLPTEDFPGPKSMELPTKWMVMADDLGRIVRHCLHAVSEDASRFYLNGAYFECREKGTLRVVATDGHRLVLNEIQAAKLLKEAARIIVPTRTLIAVERHCKTIPGMCVEVRSGIEGIEFAFDFGREGIVLSKAIDGTFPDYERVIPQGNDKLLLINADDLDQALAQFPKRGVRDKNRGVKLSLKKDRIDLSMPPSEGSPGMKQTVSCQYEGPSLEIGFQASYLRDALSILGDAVGIAFADPGSPILMMSDEFPQVVLMPMRV